MQDFRTASVANALAPLMELERMRAPSGQGPQNARFNALAMGGGPTNAAANYLSRAEGMVGMNENAQRAALQDYMATGGANLDPATRAWCAAFVNATLGHAGIQGTGSNMARSFLDWGTPVDTPQRGDVAVFSRGDPNGPYGHVGFFKGYDDAGNVLVLGGNQGDAVSVAPYSANSLLGFRRAPS